MRRGDLKDSYTGYDDACKSPCFPERSQTSSFILKGETLTTEGKRKHVCGPSDHLQEVCVSAEADGLTLVVQNGPQPEIGADRIERNFSLSLGSASETDSSSSEGGIMWNTSLVADDFDADSVVIIPSSGVLLPGERCAEKDYTCHDIGVYRSGGQCRPFFFRYLREMCNPHQSSVTKKPSRVPGQNVRPG